MSFWDPNFHGKMVCGSFLRLARPQSSAMLRDLEFQRLDTTCLSLEYDITRCYNLTKCWHSQWTTDILCRYQHPAAFFLETAWSRQSLFLVYEIASDWKFESWFHCHCHQRCNLTGYLCLTGNPGPEDCSHHGSVTRRPAKHNCFSIGYF